jgi:hypothetical protein
MKVTPSNNMFWIHDLIGRGRWCWPDKNGVLVDRDKGMWPEMSPPAYQQAYRKYLKEQTP